MFGYPHVLQIHKKSVHENEKRFPCKICSKMFVNVGLVNNHIKTVHVKSEVYPCNLCAKSFYYSCVLKRHMKDVHFVFDSQTSSNADGFDEMETKILMDDNCIRYSVELLYPKMIFKKLQSFESCNDLNFN